MKERMERVRRILEESPPEGRSARRKPTSSPAAKRKAKATKALDAKDGHAPFVGAWRQRSPEAEGYAREANAVREHEKHSPSKRQKTGPILEE